jgi:invasion protein IalB
MTQTSYYKGNRNAKVSSISIGYIPKSNTYVGRFGVPLGVSFAKGLTLEMGTVHLANLQFNRCENDGCYVFAYLSPSLIEAMQSPGSGKGAMDIVSPDGRKFQLPIDLNGFSDGLGQLKQWTTQNESPDK